MPAAFVAASSVAVVESYPGAWESRAWAYHLPWDSPRVFPSAPRQPLRKECSCRGVGNYALIIESPVSYTSFDIGIYSSGEVRFRWMCVAGSAASGVLKL